MNECWEDAPAKDGLWWAVDDGKRKVYHMVVVAGGVAHFFSLDTEPPGQEWFESEVRDQGQVDARRLGELGMRWQRVMTPIYRWPLLPEEDYSP